VKLALFEFDGTISHSDSFLLFMRKASPYRYFLTCGRYSPKLHLYLAGKYPNQLLKEEFLTAMFRGYLLAALQQIAGKFCKNSLPGIIRAGALPTIRKYRQQGDRVVVVTASPRIFLEPWCKEHNLEIIGSELHAEAEIVTGKLTGKNCMGEEKVQRIRERYTLSNYSEIHAYGDSSADLPMLALADKQNRFYKPFR